MSVTVSARSSAEQSTWVMVANSDSPRLSLTATSSYMDHHDHLSHTRRQHKEAYRKQQHPSPTTSTPQLKKESPSSSDDLTLVPTALDAHRRDLFGAYPIEVKGVTLEALDEQLRVVSNEELVFEIRGGHLHPVLTSIFAASLQDAGLFSCYVAAAHSFHQQRRSEAGFKPSDHFMKLQSQGLSYIRDRIMQPGAENDDHLIAGILQLMVADSVCGNIPSLVSHQRGVRKLISMRNADNNEPMHQASMGILVVIEFYMALVQFLYPTAQSPQPAKNLLRYIKHPFPASVCIRISKLPSGLEDLVVSSQVSLQTIDLLERLSNWSSAMKDINTEEDTARIAFARLFAEPMDCSRTLIFIMRNLRQANQEDTIEFIICLGITIIIKHQRTTRKTDHLDDELLHRFIRAIKQYSNPKSNELPSLIWLVTVVAWRTQLTFPSHAEDLVDFTIHKYDQARDLEHVQTVWKSFLWHEKFGSAWTRCWQAGLSRRKASTTPQRSISEERCLGVKAPPHCLFSKNMKRIKLEHSADSTASSSSGILSAGQSSSNLSRAPSTLPSDTSALSSSSKQG